MYCVLYTSSTPAPLSVNIGLPTMPIKDIIRGKLSAKRILSYFCHIFTTELK